MTEETKSKIGKALKGRTSHRKGKTISTEHKERISKANQNKGTKKVICITTNKVFNSLKDVATEYQVSYNYVSMVLNGNRVGIKGHKFKFYDK